VGLERFRLLSGHARGARHGQRWNGLSGGADYHLGYDAADQLLGAEVRDPISGVLQKTYGYAYDPAANRTLEQTSTHGGAQQEITLSRASYNSLNQMTSRTGGSGALEVSGTVNEPAQVSIAGQPASALWKRTDGQSGFLGTAQVSSGANQVAVTATDGSGWEHRAYWGANQIPWGTDGTESRRYQGSLPATGQWVRLEVDAASVGLEGRTMSGMAYSQVGGQADWDHSGKVSATGVETTYVDDTLPAGGRRSITKVLSNGVKKPTIRPGRKPCTNFL
jgi:hypothetical protein